MLLKEKGSSEELTIDLFGEAAVISGDGSTGFNKNGKDLSGNVRVFTINKDANKVTQLGTTIIGEVFLVSRAIEWLCPRMGERWQWLPALTTESLI